MYGIRNIIVCYYHLWYFFFKLSILDNTIQNLDEVAFSSTITAVKDIKPTCTNVPLVIQADGLKELTSYQFQAEAIYDTEVNIFITYFSMSQM